MTTKIFTPYVLGLDIGIASVGAAVINNQPDKETIIELFVRTFEKAETTRGESLNLARREARSTRRRLRRRTFRLLSLLRLMHHEKIITQTTPNCFHLPVSAWQLRAEGLDRCLKPKEWATVLYHLLKYRGFQSNRKNAPPKDADQKTILGSIASNHHEVAQKNYRSIGEMFFRDEKFTQQKHNKAHKYTHTIGREDIVAELNLLFEQQRKFNNPASSKEFGNRIEKLLNARRATITDEQLELMVGKCSYLNTERRAAKHSYWAERFIWLAKLNNLTVTQEGKTRFLNDEEKNQIRELPYQFAKLTFKQVQNKLELLPNSSFNFMRSTSRSKNGDQQDPAEQTLFEAKAFHALRKAYDKAQLKSQWQKDALNADLLNQLGEALSCCKDDDILFKKLADTVNKEVIDAISGISFSGYIKLSHKVLAKIIPLMEQGLRTDQALLQAGFNQPSYQQPSQLGFLPKPDKEEIINPVVYRAINQACKVINAIIKKYGQPFAVHIELARDMSKNYTERARIEREQRNNHIEQEKTRQQLQNLFGIADPKPFELLKYRLYEEQQAKCAYSQKPIELARLFEDNYVQIDHIIPYSRSYDNSYRNKVLVLTDENQHKLNRTPFEYLTSLSQDHWQSFVAWVKANKNFSLAKRNLLLRREDPSADGQFRERHLNDTRYITSELKALLEKHLIWHPQTKANQRCVAINGQVTAYLRSSWGLVKNRPEGDLHHALDAAVIATCDTRLLQKVINYHKWRELRNAPRNYKDVTGSENIPSHFSDRNLGRFPLPWLHFPQELLGHLSSNPAKELRDINGYDNTRLEQLKPIRVSRMVSRRGTGPAHKETIRSIGTQQKLLANNTSHLKMPLTSLFLKEFAKNTKPSGLTEITLEQIVGYDDPRNHTFIEALKARFKAFNGDGKKAFAEAFYKPSHHDKQAPSVRSINIINSEQKSGVLVRHGIADNGSIIRTDVFSYQGKFYLIPLYVADCVKPQLPNKAITSNKIEKDWITLTSAYQFLFSLFPNDWLEVVDAKDKFVAGYFNSVDRSNAKIKIRAHDQDQRKGKGGFWRVPTITAKQLRKYHVDMLGQLYAVKAEKRQPLPGARQDQITDLPDDPLILNTPVTKTGKRKQPIRNDHRELA